MAPDAGRRAAIVGACGWPGAGRCGATSGACRWTAGRWPVAGPGRWTCGGPGRWPGPGWPGRWPGGGMRRSTGGNWRFAPDGGPCGRRGGGPCGGRYPPGRSSLLLSLGNVTAANLPLYRGLGRDLRPRFDRSFGCGAPLGPARARPLGRRDDAEDVGLHEMIPAASPADLDDVDREFFFRGGESDEFFGRSCRPGNRSELIAVDP